MARTSVCGSITALVALSLVGPAGCGDGEGASAPAQAPARNPLTIVRATPGVSASTVLAVHACAGLLNRVAGGSVFVEREAHDAGWVAELGLVAHETLDEADFLSRCVARVGRCVRYNYQQQQALLPSVLTLAAAEGAVPLDEAASPGCTAPVVDAVDVFADKPTPLAATRYVFDTYGPRTTGLAMLSPGYDRAPADPARPALTSDMGPALVDLVFSERLFALYLVNGCVKDDPERALLSDIVNAGRWPSPVAVYGYNSTWNVLGGYLYEAQTRCLDSRNMGAIASEAGNLSYYSTVGAPITGPGVVQQNPPETTQYDPNKNYAAFFVGDGDNLAYMLSARRDWFRQRLADCAADPACPPLTWTISPHLARLAPDVLRWYYDRSHETKRDYFALPPSGHLYAYPSSLAPADQDRFAAATEADARVLGVAGVVHWEWFDSWRDAEEIFLPKYGRQVRGVFPTNVPYKGIAFPWWPKEQLFEVIAGAGGAPVVVFKPREWRGVNDDSDPFFHGPQKMADELAALPRGSVTWVYMTSDGGLTLENSFAAMAKLLPSHVELVSADTATRLALAASGR